MSALHFCFSFGNMLTPLIMIAALSLTGQFHLTFWIVALSVAAMLWPLSRFASPTMPTVDPDPATLAALKHRDPLLLGLFMLLFSIYVGIEITFAGWVTAYGALSGLTTEQAALLAWYRNNVLHLFALPALVAFAFRSRHQRSLLLLCRRHGCRRALLSVANKRLHHFAQSFHTQLRIADGLLYFGRATQSASGARHVDNSW